MENQKEHIRNVMLREFKQGNSAAATAEKICSLYGKGVITDRAVRNWFVKFRSGDETLKDEPRMGRPSDINDDIMSKLLEKNPYLSTREMAERLNISQSTVCRHLTKSIPQERLDKINAELESDVMIRAIHDVKGIDIGNSLVRYKAEMDFDGGELTRSYLDKQDLNQMLEDVRKMQTIDELEEFMLKHGENIVDMMGGEIDRIELKLRVSKKWK